jgi:hypothetical protein
VETQLRLLDVRSPFTQRRRASQPPASRSSRASPLVILPGWPWWSELSGGSSDGPATSYSSCPIDSAQDPPLLYGRAAATSWADHVVRRLIGYCT